MSAFSAVRGSDVLFPNYFGEDLFLYRSYGMLFLTPEKSVKPLKAIITD